jgi:amidase
MKAFESIGCVVEEAVPDYSPDAVWEAFKQIRAWQQGGALAAHYRNPSKRALLKPEAIFEIESGMKLSAFDVSAASAVRTTWYQAFRRFFDRYDYLILPTAQVFPFDVEKRWPEEIAGHKMETYHEWMKAVCLISMSGCPSLAVPAGFSENGLPIGVQIVGRNHGEISCLQLARAYELVTNWTGSRLPPLLNRA